MKPPVVVIAGQTCSGKNDLALKLAKKYNGIIINADSRQIYRDLNIGTAKPTPDKVKKDGTWFIEGIPHYLYGFVSLTTKYNIFKYQKDVRKVIEKNKEKVIFLVGGTGLYIDSVVFSYELPKVLNQDFSKLSMEEIKNTLGKEYDKLSNSERNNRIRLESRLRRISNPKRSQIKKLLYLVLDIDAGILKERIIKRTNLMFKNGLMEENEKIHQKYESYELPSLNTIGYKEFDAYFKKEITLDTLKGNIITHTNQYAKRQRTWFKRNKDGHNIKNYEEADALISKFLKDFN